jgi:hypothetical protein
MEHPDLVKNQFGAIRFVGLKLGGWKDGKPGGCDVVRIKLIKSFPHSAVLIESPE